VYQQLGQVLPLPPAVLLLLLLPLALLWCVLLAALPLLQLPRVISSRCLQLPLLLLPHGELVLPAVPWLAPPPTKQIAARFGAIRKQGHALSQLTSVSTGAIA
jgi:hypothetical protein